MTAVNKDPLKIFLPRLRRTFIRGRVVASTITDENSARENMGILPKSANPRLVCGWEPSGLKDHWSVLCRMNRHTSPAAMRGVPLNRLTYPKVITASPSTPPQKTLNNETNPKRPKETLRSRSPRTFSDGSSEKFFQHALPVLTALRASSKRF